MNRSEAVTKVLKLRNLAARAGSPAEADTARRTASKFVQEFSLTEKELSIGNKARAFDDLASRLYSFLHKHSGEIPSSVGDLLPTIKRKTEDTEKAAGLDKIVTGIRVVSMFLGHVKAVQDLKNIIETVLREHDVTV